MIRKASDNVRIQIPANRTRGIEQKNLADLFTLAKAIATANERPALQKILVRDFLNFVDGTGYDILIRNAEETSFHSFLSSVDSPIHEQSVTTSFAVDSSGNRFFKNLSASSEPETFTLSTRARKNILSGYFGVWHKSGATEAIAFSVPSSPKIEIILFLFAGKTGVFTERKEAIREIMEFLGQTIKTLLAQDKLEGFQRELNEFRGQQRSASPGLPERATSPFKGMIGDSPAMQKVYNLVRRVAPTDSTVLILGETGTGKELIAKAIHESSPRKGKPLVKLNCAALPPHLIESELFGYEKGSFTGAMKSKPGKFELANNGTLFLDEIGELPIDLQAKILRVLQEREMERIGGDRTIKLNVRFIAATNKDLEKEVSERKFRNDLYFRLAVFPIGLRPLRERKDDIFLLTNFFVDRFAQKAGKPVTGIASKAMKKLLNYAWPGNVRELEHLIERSVLLSNGPILKELNISVEKNHDLKNDQTGNKIRPLAAVEREYILKALAITDGRISGPNGAAVKLKLPATTLISKMQKLGIKKEHTFSN